MSYSTQPEVTNRWMCHLWFGDTLVHTEFFEYAPTKEHLKELTGMLPMPQRLDAINALNKAPTIFTTPIEIPWVLEFGSSRRFRCYLSVEYGEALIHYNFLKFPVKPSTLLEAK